MAQGVTGKVDAEMGRLALVIVFALWVGWTVYREVTYIQLRRLVNGLEHPELWLPRRERQAHARKLLRREDEEYTQRVIEQTTRFIQQEGQK